jgi:hypothetical protein
MGPIGCPETLVRNCHNTLLNIPEERRSQGRETSGSINCGEFLAYMRNCQLLKKDSSPLHSRWLCKLQSSVRTVHTSISVVS